MTLQNLITNYVVSSVLLSCAITRLFRERVLDLLTPVMIAVFFTTQVILTVFFYVFVWPRISPLRSLPCAPQKHPLRRLFKEPCPWHFEAWTNSVPNEGLIRYYGILNIERVLVTSPEVVKEVLQTRVYNFQKQYHQRSYFERTQGYGLVLQEGDAHKQARRLIGHALGQKRVTADYWPIIQRKVSQMLEVVFNAAHDRPIPAKDGFHSTKSAPIDMDELIRQTVFDVSGEVSYGIDFKSVLQPQIHYAAMDDYNATFLGIPPTRQRLLLGMVLPKWWVDLLPIKYNWIAARGLKHFDQIGRRFMAKTPPEVAEAEPERSVMHELIAGKQMDDDELWEQYRMLLPGALHNTASAMVSAIWFLGQPKYSHIQERLREELQKDLQQFDDARVPLSVFEKCSYLKAVINEVLRLHPSASWFGREVAVPTEINGVVLPRGLLLGFSPWAFHRDMSIWGADAAEFKPERWLQGHKPMTTAAENQAWLTFGAGPRRCVGEALAKAELYCLIPRLFHRFHIDLATSENPPKISHHVTVAYREPMCVKITDHGTGEISSSVGCTETGKVSRLFDGILEVNRKEGTLSHSK